MDGKTVGIRYQQWVQVIQDWSNSGLSKRDYCQQNGIDEKKLYYYQRRIRSIIASQREQQALPEGSSGFSPVAISAGHESGRPQIVKLRFSGMEQADSTLVSFSVNGMNFSVPENIPSSFLAKLLGAASHGTC